MCRVIPPGSPLCDPSQCSVFLSTLDTRSRIWYQGYPSISTPSIHPNPNRSNLLTGTPLIPSTHHRGFTLSGYSLHESSNLRPNVPNINFSRGDPLVEENSYLVRCSLRRPVPFHWVRVKIQEVSSYTDRIYTSCLQLRSFLRSLYRLSDADWVNIENTQNVRQVKIVCTLIIIDRIKMRTYTRVPRIGLNIR